MQRDFLRQKARTLRLLAQACFDMDTSRRLRDMADEFETMADRAEKKTMRLLPGFLGREGRSGGTGGMRA
jgi:hypothetical protein